MLIIIQNPQNEKGKRESHENLVKCCLCFSSQRFVFHPVNSDMTGFLKINFFVKEKNIKKVSKIFENEFKKVYYDYIEYENVLQMEAVL